MFNDHEIEKLYSSCYVRLFNEAGACAAYIWRILGETVEMWSRHTRHVIYLPPTTAGHLAGTHSYNLHRRP